MQLKTNHTFNINVKRSELNLSLHFGHFYQIDVFELVGNLTLFLFCYALII